MPKKPKPRPAKPKDAKSSPHNRNPKGKNQHWGGNGFRIAFARRMLAAGRRYSEVRVAIVEHFKVNRTTAEKDIAEAKLRNEELTEHQVPEILTRNSVKLDVIADLATEDGKYSDAVAALREFHRIHGMHAAKKVHISADVTIAIDVNAIVGILDETGIAALEIVMAQIEAAKASGELAPPQPQLEAGSDEDGEEVN